MKRKITHLLILAAALTGAACGEQTALSQTGGRAEAIVAELHDPASKKSVGRLTPRRLAQLARKTRFLLSNP